MIFDADSHLTLTETPSQSVEQLIENMDRAGIERSLVWLQPPYMRNLDEANRCVYESAREHEARLVAFGWVDPHFGIEKSMEQLRTCLDVYGMKGIKLNGAQNQFYIDDEALEPIYDELERRGSVLALHIGADFYDFTHPYRAAKIAGKHPDLKMLLAHMGGAGVPNLGNSCIEMAAQCPNMMLVGSAISYKTVLEAIKTLGAERVCFGSDAPFALQHVEVAAYEALLKDEVTAEEHEMIMGLNLKKFLGV